MKYHLFHIYEHHYELVFELHTQDSSQQAINLFHLPNLHLPLLIAHLCRSTVGRNQMEATLMLYNFLKNVAWSV